MPILDSSSPFSSLLVSRWPLRFMTASLTSSSQPWIPSSLAWKLIVSLPPSISSTSTVSLSPRLHLSLRHSHCVAHGLRPIKDLRQSTVAQISHGRSGDSRVAIGSSTAADNQQRAKEDVRSGSYYAAAKRPSSATVDSGPRVEQVSFSPMIVMVPSICGESGQICYHVFRGKLSKLW